MKGTVLYDGATYDPFNIFSGMKQGCVLAPTLFGIVFATLLKHAFGESTEGIYLRTRSDGNLFKLPRLRAKTRVNEKYVRDLLADDAAITTHTQEDLQRLLCRFSEACRHFGLTISLAQTQVMKQDIEEIPSLFFHNYKLHVVHEFVYLGLPSLYGQLSINSELNKQFGKAAISLSKLTTCV